MVTTNINEITITELSAMIKNRTISVREVVQEYLHRIGSIDKGENGLNSIIEINPDALKIAEQLDHHKADDSSMLYGIPILLKDNINTADNMHTSAGSLALAQSIATYDAEVVATLRSKGAVILGKTNMTEFANYMTKGMPGGYSSRGGQVKSPYKSDENPSGSSTGSAVAVAANLCTAALGTDTSGSVISPAIKNGIVGFRPSQGTLSQRGLIPISFSLDMIGTMTRSVTDTIIMFGELSDKNIKIDESIELKGITIGIDQLAVENMTDEELKKINTIIEKLEKAGANIKRLDIKTIPLDYINHIQKYEFKHAINSYLSELPNDYSIRTLKDIIEYNKQNKELALKYGQTLLIDAEENTTGVLNVPIYLEMIKEMEHTKKYMIEQLNDIDVCIMFHDNPIIQFSGLPSIAIPCGLYNDGMPFGINITALTDSNLLNISYQMEQIVGRRAEPKCLN